MSKHEPGYNYGGKPIAEDGVYHQGGTGRWDSDFPTQDAKLMIDVGNIFGAAEELLLKKHADYGPKNISQSPGGPLNGLRVRMWDKLARINHLLDSGAEPENESLRDSFIDLLNYSAIAMMVLDNTWPKE